MMSVNQQIIQLRHSADELLEKIDNEYWDEAKILSKKWDISVRDFMCNLSPEKFIANRGEVESLAMLNKKIENHLVTLRAKVLTKIQENNTSRNAIQLYNKTV
jgi:predicted HD phosphohydrolase